MNKLLKLTGITIALTTIGVAVRAIIKANELEDNLNILKATIETIQRTIQ